MTDIPSSISQDADEAEVDFALSYISAADDEAIAAIIRDNLEQAGLNIPGTAYFDPELDHLSVFYQARPGARNYFILKDNAGTVLGGVGYAEFAGLEDCAELQKLYLHPACQGQGLGRLLMEFVLQEVQEIGYRRVYLETHSSLQAACALYQKLGFVQVEQPCATAHSSMDRFYLKELPAA